MCPQCKLEDSYHIDENNERTSCAIAKLNHNIEQDHYDEQQDGYWVYND